MKIEFPVKEIDTHLRAGQGAAARTLLQSLPPGQLERKQLADYAWLTLRADLPLLGVRALSPIVRPLSGDTAWVTDREKAVYAACLGKIGACEESLALLKGLDARRLPEVHLFRSFAFSSQWEFARTIPELKTYLESAGLSSYEKLVAKANLAAALVYERKYISAEPLLRELLFEASVRGLSLLLGKAYELTAASFILQRKWAEAEAFLERSGRALASTGGRDEFFARKWRVIFNLVRSRPGASDALRSLRQEATDKGYWESIRDCDRFRAIFDKDETLFQKVYFGSPYSDFRRRLGEEAGLPVPERYTWWLAGGESDHGPYDLFEGTGLPPALRLKPGQLLHRLLACLVSDFYRPFRLATLHYQCFPTEFFNPVTSAPRVYEALRRLRRWFKDAEIPLLVKEMDGAYVLEGTAPVALVLQGEPASGDRVSLLLRKLRANWSTEAFKVGDVATFLDISRRTALEILSAGVSEGNLTREGNGRATRYRFPFARAQQAA